MKFLPVAVCVALMAGCATHKADPYADVSDKELESLFSQAKKEEPLPYCDTLVPITNALFQRDPSNQEKEAFRDYADFQCALDEKRWEDAYASMVRYEKSSGRSMGSFGFRMAYFTDHYDEAVERLEAIGPGSYAGDIFDIDQARFWRFFYTLSSDGRTDLQQRAVSAMTGSPYFMGLDRDFRSGLAAWTLRFAADSGAFQNAEQWISVMEEPVSYLPMLADRRFEPIWPQLEKAVGEHFVAINERHVKTLKKQYQSDLSNRDLYQKLAHALVFAGRFEQAVEFVKTPRPEQFASVTEDEAWALNMKVVALDALGQKEQATALFDRLATIAVNDDNKRWLINFTINRAHRLAGYGQWRKALEAIEYAERFSGSDYAATIIRSVKVCALANLGEDVSGLMDEVYALRKDSYENAAEAMVCAGHNDTAAEIMITALQDESKRRSAIEALQDSSFSLYPVYPESPRLHPLISTHPSLKAAFEKEARVIPQQYIPQAQINSL